MKHKPGARKFGKGARQRAGSSYRTRRKSGQRKVLSLTASAEPSRRGGVSMREVMEFYKPIKKPVTLRLDADVLAWFRRDGRRYQTRINAALRRV
ncbi:MAG TPA: BrnA antitoxin family protein, partial [Candidatus Sulfotelmatobacter sp.]